MGLFSKQKAGEGLGFRVSLGFWGLGLGGGSDRCLGRLVGVLQVGSSHNLLTGVPLDIRRVK